MSGLIPVAGVNAAANDKSYQGQATAMEIDEPGKSRHLRGCWNRNREPSAPALTPTNYYCGICERRDQDPAVERTSPGNLPKDWSRTIGGSAHKTCHELIQPTQKGFIKALNYLFGLESESRILEARIQANEAVRKACGSKTLFTYFKEEGEAALTRLFNTVGVKAAQDYKTKLEKKEIDALIASLNTVDV